MHEAARRLLGKHDFRSFETDWPNKVTSVRTVFEISVVRRPVWEVFSASSTEYSVPSSQYAVPVAGRTEPPATNLATFADAPAPTGDIICIDIIADGFLYNMVRSIVGTLVNVGRGKWPREEVSRILEARDRSIAGSTAPACGLFLVTVWYE
jgi:tRNA pseudouridine38-40 synthase